MIGMNIAHLIVSLLSVYTFVICLVSLFFTVYFIYLLLLYMQTMGFILCCIWKYNVCCLYLQCWSTKIQVVLKNAYILGEGQCKVSKNGIKINHHGFESWKRDINPKTDFSFSIEKAETDISRKYLTVATKLLDTEVCAILQNFSSLSQLKSMGCSNSEKDCTVRSVLKNILF